jgi:broad specificity phosphatase PhoE
MNKLTASLFGVIVAMVCVPAIATDRVLTFKDAAKELSKGGFVLMMRHAITVPGVGDPAEFDLTKCSTQRNLSDIGRAQSKRIGEDIARAGIKFSAVRSSQWCRCIDTARIAFAQATPWKALNSFFADRSTERKQTRELHQAASQLAPGTNVIWVTHQVNISAALGTFAGQGEIVVARVVAGKLKTAFRM